MNKGKKFFFVTMNTGYIPSHGTYTRNQGLNLTVVDKCTKSWVQNYLMCNFENSTRLYLQVVRN